MGSGQFVTVEIDLSALTKFEKAANDYPYIVREEMGKAVTELVLKIEAKAKELCPVKTGKLRASIHTVVVDWANKFVATNTSYAADVEFGTKAHDIEPRTDQALVFPVKIGTKFAPKGRGKNFRVEVTPVKADIYRKKVHHPGTAPQPYLEPAFLYGRQIAPKVFEEAMERALKHLQRSLV